MLLRSLERKDRRGARRIKPRLEDLRRVSVHSIIAKNEDATIKVPEGRIDFVDQIVGGEMVLDVYFNNHPTNIRYKIDELPIPHNLVREIPEHKAWRYYVLGPDGRRYCHIYINIVTGKMGVRTQMGADYTSCLIGEKCKTEWRKRTAAGKPQPAYRWRRNRSKKNSG